MLEIYSCYIYIYITRLRKGPLNQNTEKGWAHNIIQRYRRIFKGAIENQRQQKNSSENQNCHRILLLSPEINGAFFVYIKASGQRVHLVSLHHRNK